jgi:hydroxymethylglutaryl-CoA synthase
MLLLERTQLAFDELVDPGQQRREGAVGGDPGNLPAQGLGIVAAACRKQAGGGDVGCRPDMPHGILAYAAYLPRHRVDREELAAQLGSVTGKGRRVIASYDEDPTTMGVETARRAAAGARPGGVFFATTNPPYLDKTNATAIHTALDIGHEGLAVDTAGAARSAVGALGTAALAGGLAVMSDVVTGLPGSADESGGADGAAAFLFGPAEEAAVEILAGASASAEFLDRWRLPGERASHVWEERFGLEMYMPLVQDVVGRALAAAGIDEADRVVVSSPHTRTAATTAKQLGAGGGLALGYAGAADLGLRLAAVLDEAEPGQTILLLSAADGADAMVLRVGGAIATARRGGPIADQLGGGREVSYAQYLSWRGLLEREPPRRPEPERPAGPPAARGEAWKFAFVGTACRSCGQVHVPPRRICVSCGTVDEMERRPLADARGTVATYTVDRLAFSPSPPMIDAVVDFDGGGRYTLEVADAAPEDVEIGTRVELTFRKLYTTGGVHNYFWKVRPI